ncbi:MAG TPA: DEAD/DEAH box helicase, partial [Actinomycetota bacterium]|nr:DEAD/DEAH box helicase [Actinomycetota bacterium]
SGPVHDALRERLTGRGASFWPELLSAADHPDDQTVLAALWDLVWAGEVTNDTFAPVRALLAGRRKAASTRRPRPGRLSRTGPPSAAGRWSLVSELLQPAPAATESAHARALQLLERHGVLTREAVLAENAPGGFAAVYGVLKALEESGRVRRGYFVAGLGAAQFAMPGAVDRLRGMRDLEKPDAGRGEMLVMAATDPAQPYGAALPWPDSPGRPARAAGAYVVLEGGMPQAILERGGRTVATFEGSSPPVWAEALVTLVKDGRLRRLEVQKVDGAPAHDSGAADALREAGFTDSYKGLVLRG